MYASYSDFSKYELIFRIKKLDFNFPDTCEMPSQLKKY
jgi:hypothetical protein